MSAKDIINMLEEASTKIHICSHILFSTTPEKQQAINELRQLCHKLSELIEILKKDLEEVEEPYKSWRRIIK
jgi:uncharacterized protein Yka (UPF0111/DUF47 family)